MSFVTLVPEEEADHLTIGDTLEIICGDGNKVSEYKVEGLESYKEGIMITANKVRGEEQ